MACDTDHYTERTDNIATLRSMIVEEYDAACVVPPDATASLDDAGNIVLTLG